MGTLSKKRNIKTRRGTKTQKWTRKATIPKTIKTTKIQTKVPVNSKLNLMRKQSKKCDHVKGNTNNNYTIYSLLKCSYLNDELELYDFIVNDIIDTYYRSNRTNYSFITYVKKNYKTFSSGSCATLVRAFTRFQEEVLPTENLEHILQTC